MLLDYSVTKAEPEPRSFAGFLGSEEGIKNLSRVVFRNSRSVVLDDDSDSPSRKSGAEANAALGLMCLNRLARVVYDIEEHLLNLVRVQHHQGKIRSQVADDLDITRPELIVQELHRGFHQTVYIRKLALGRMPSGEAEQILHDFLAAHCAFVNQIQVPMVSRICIIHLQQL